MHYWDRDGPSWYLWFNFFVTIYNAVATRPMRMLSIHQTPTTVTSTVTVQSISRTIAVLSKDAPIGNSTDLLDSIRISCHGVGTIGGMTVSTSPKLA
jgi:hypothetical protein